jgi:hypothetical protein
VSPVDGDRYQIPPGVASRYATIALRAAGAPGGHSVHWAVDGTVTSQTRWPLAKGIHRIRATAGPMVDEVRIEVE